MTARSPPPKPPDSNPTGPAAPSAGRPRRPSPKASPPSGRPSRPRPPPTSPRGSCERSARSRRRGGRSASCSGSTSGGPASWSPPCSWFSSPLRRCCAVRALPRLPRPHPSPRASWMRGPAERGRPRAAAQTGDTRRGAAPGRRSARGPRARQGRGRRPAAERFRGRSPRRGREGALVVRSGAPRQGGRAGPAPTGDGRGTGGRRVGRCQRHGFPRGAAANLGAAPWTARALRPR